MHMSKSAAWLSDRSVERRCQTQWPRSAFASIYGQHDHVGQRLEPVGRAGSYGPQFQPYDGPVYRDRLIIDNGDTSAVAGMLGLAVESAEKVDAPIPRPMALSLPTEERMTLRPTAEILAELADRYTNGLIGKICQVSETTVRKWLRDAGVRRQGKKRRTGEMADWQVTLLRSDLRNAITSS